MPNFEVENYENSLLCLVLLQVPKCFVHVQIFWASPKIWLHLVLLQKLLCRHKNQFYWMQIIFLSGTICKYVFVLALKIWTSPKHFGTCKRKRHKNLVCRIWFFQHDFSKSKYRWISLFSKSGCNFFHLSIPPF